MADLTLTSAPTRKIEVGFNYPWAWDAYGDYFGGGRPPGTNSTLDTWTTALRTNLFVLKNEFGVKVVRIFLMCNADNFGTARKVTAPDEGLWWYELDYPASFSPKYTEHFERMLGIFADLRMRVIPSLLDFPSICSTFNQGEHGCGCKPDILGIPLGRSLEHPQGPERFLDMVLEPLLDKSVQQGLVGAIHAWEVMNEPIWASHSASPFTEHPIPTDVLATFIDQAIHRISQRGVLASTVGHRFRSDWSLFSTGSLKQFHYYPSTLPGILPLVENDLPDFNTTGAQIIGEIGTKLKNTLHEATWPELDALDPSLQQDTRKRVFWRLRSLAEKGYPLALLWPDLDGGAPGANDPLKLSAEAQDGLRDYQEQG